MADIHDADTIELEVPIFQLPLETPQPYSSLIRIDFGAHTDVGKVRTNNEDAYVIYRIGRYWEKFASNLTQGELPGRFDEAGYALAIADGMGGAAGGDIASSMAIRVCINLVLQSTRWALKLDNPETREAEIAAAKQRAEEYFHKVDAALLNFAETHPRFKGMGTTLTGAYSSGDDLFIMHIGDSRAYLFRENSLRQLTHDHTLAQLLVKTGDLTAEEAMTHRFRHTLTSCLGGEDARIQLDIQHRRLRDKDRLLLCTDGLTDMVDDSVISEVLAAEESSAEACKKLVQKALDNGGQDNVTAILAAYTIPPRNS